MVPLRKSAPAKLNALPADILIIILGYLDTAQSVAHLAATCKGLYQFVFNGGWRIFVTGRFSSLKLPNLASDGDWFELAQALTGQSRDWDRRAFIFHSLSPPQTRRPNGRRIHGAQSIPGNIIVDAHMHRTGSLDEELVLWGAGEDILGRIRRKDRSSVVTENWHCYKGAETGFTAGKDDTTAISILKGRHYAEDPGFEAVVGRANGDLRLFSAGDANFGHTLINFRPSPSSTTEQREIQTIDIEAGSNLLAAGTRENVFLYSIPGHDEGGGAHETEPPCVNPLTAVSLRNTPKSPSFDYIRAARFLNKDTVAVASNGSFHPIQLLHVTPAGLEVSQAASMPSEYPQMMSSPRTVRALLPVDTRSVAGGSTNVVLSSWDDGTIRLQDLRTPSPIDRIYQDNFEVSTPINALVSHGLERFVAGSAFSHMLKIFDYRWPKGYYHTDSLPCSNVSPYPLPKPPTLVPEPYHDKRPRCNHMTGRLCRWHALSRHDFYRPNCNIYLPFRNYASSPIYSLAKPSDVSPSIYAGLSGLLVEVTLKSGAQTSTAVPAVDAPYIRQKGKVAILETGDGSAISDVSKCQRVPEIRRQSFSNREGEGSIARRQHRLDEALQDPREWQELTIRLS
ncbi:hypothetical protein GGS20DRAFT_217776 [Poronia punctata]|nr:hypothetical protein GGS20DRAFT_217776 [Poronia punctata]